MNLFPPPASLGLPLSLGGDLLVDFKNNPSGDGSTFEDWDDGVEVTLEIDGATRVVAPATISGAVASIRVAAAVCDLIKNGMYWRLVVETPGSPAVQTVAVNGRVVRADGGN